MRRENIDQGHNNMLNNATIQKAPAKAFAIDYDAMTNFSFYDFGNYSLSDLVFDPNDIRVLSHHRIWPFFFWITFLIGMIGNWLVVYIVFMKKQMRTVTNMYLFNLAIVDILYLLSTIPNTSYGWTDYWPFGGFMCKLAFDLILHMYSETCLKRPLINRQNKGIKDRW